MIKPQEYKKRKEKWEEKSREYEFNTVRSVTCNLTVKNTLRLLKDTTKGRVLDIGCGFGEIDVLLAQQTNFDIIGCDISEFAIRAAQNNAKKAGLSHRIRIERGDVFDLKYPDGFFDIVFSFGYVSAVTYPGVQKEVARVLKPRGILICDFINCLSLYKFLRVLKKVLIGKKQPYFLTLKGIKKEFAKANIDFQRQVLFNTFPPINLNINPKIFLCFENTIGWLLKPLLGRVRLARFEKRNSLES